MMRRGSVTRTGDLRIPRLADENGMMQARYVPVTAEGIEALSAAAEARRRRPHPPGPRGAGARLRVVDDGLPARLRDALRVEPQVQRLRQLALNGPILGAERLRGAAHAARHRLGDANLVARPAARLVLLAGADDDGGAVEGRRRAVDEPLRRRGRATGRWQTAWSLSTNWGIASSSGIGPKGRRRKSVSRPARTTRAAGKRRAPARRRVSGRRTGPRRCRRRRAARPARGRRQRAQPGRRASAGPRATTTSVASNRSSIAA